MSASGLPDDLPQSDSKMNRLKRAFLGSANLAAEHRLHLHLLSD
jgi:hypothetical protein